MFKNLLRSLSKPEYRIEVKTYGDGKVMYSPEFRSSWWDGWHFISCEDYNSPDCGDYYFEHLERAEQVIKDHKEKHHQEKVMSVKYLKDNG